MRMKIIAAVGMSVLLGVGACSTSAVPRPEVTESEAEASLDVMVSIASRRTPGAMDELCQLADDDCNGISGVVRTDPAGPASAPRPDDRPVVLCSRAVSDRGWLLVIEGTDGIGRSYVSQMVFTRDAEGRVVPAREPAYWLGVGYSSAPSTGAASWSTAYGPDDNTDPSHTLKVIENARGGCDAA